MFKPEATLRLLKERFWGAKAMEHRMKRCCADNPDCPIQAECRAEYDAFVNVTDNAQGIHEKLNINIPARRKIYHQLRDLGVASVEARANLSDKRVRELGKVRE